MKANDFQIKCRRTSPKLGRDKLPYLVNFSMGLSGEAGEVTDHIKKVAFQGHELDEENVAYELGDLMYYVAMTADMIGYTLEEIMQMNQEKLAIRYPDGFSEEASRDRVDKL